MPFATPKCLILDDYGAHSSTPWAEEKLFQLLNHRFNGAAANGGDDESGAGARRGGWHPGIAGAAHPVPLARSRAVDGVPHQRAAIRRARARTAPTRYTVSIDSPVIALDARLVGYAAGIARYAMLLSEALAQLEGPEHYLVLRGRRAPDGAIGGEHALQRRCLTPPHHRLERWTLPARRPLAQAVANAAAQHRSRRPGLGSVALGRDAARPGLPAVPRDAHRRVACLLRGVGRERAARAARHRRLAAHRLRRGSAAGRRSLASARHSRSRQPCLLHRGRTPT